jgi:hypothetical protein
MTESHTLDPDEIDRVTGGFNPLEWVGMGSTGVLIGGFAGRERGRYTAEAPYIRGTMSRLQNRWGKVGGAIGLIVDGIYQYSRGQ